MPPAPPPPRDPAPGDPSRAASHAPRVVVLAGGTGGAKLAAGMQELLGDRLSVIANTGDDVEALGVHVSPDPDLCTYWLAGEIDEQRGWGIAGDSFVCFERMVAMGAPSWFGLSDRDLAACLRRRAMLDAGERQTVAQAAIAGALGVAANVYPMSDDPVRTRVRTPAGWLGLQEFLVREHAAPDILEVAIDGAAEAQPSPEVGAAIAGADAIVIGPSNPVISIGPILAVPGIRQAIAEASVPTVAVSPFVAGRAVKGPTEPFMAAAGRPATATGVAEAYGELLDGIVVDENDPEPPPSGLRTRSADTLMDGAAGRRRVAADVLAFAGVAA